MARSPYLPISLAAFVLSLLLLCGCSPSPPPPTEIETGISQAQVRAMLGEPDWTQEFILPAAPFFGPQEILTDLVPAGTPVEEWVYEIDEEVLYVWFIAEGEGQPAVIAFQRHPLGAVY